MPVPSDPFTFVNGPTQIIDATQVNARFAALYNALNPASVGIDDTNVKPGLIRQTQLAVAPQAYAYRTSVFGVANATAAVVPFDLELYDTDGIHDPAVNSSRLTCKTSGAYEVVGGVEWASNATGRRMVGIALNGVNPPALGMDARNAVSGDTTCHTATHQLRLAVNDYVELVVFQASTVSLNLVTINARNFLSMRLVGA